MLSKPYLRSLLACAVVCATSTAQAQSVSWAGADKVVRWPSNNVTYNIHSGGAPGISGGSDVAAVQTAFSNWQAISCSALTFSDQGQSVNPNTLMPVPQGGSYSPPNGKNELAWVSGSNWVYGPFVLGVTVPIFSVPNGDISEADIAFNGNVSWTTNPSTFSTVHDVLSIALHEIGHMFGAQHMLSNYNPATPPVMAPSAAPQQWQTTRQIKTDDQETICFLYPSSPYTCSNDDQCPFVVDDDSSGQEFYLARYLCQGGNCNNFTYVIPTANKGIGETCVSTQYDCAVPLFCQPLQTGSICTQNCTPPGGCPSGFNCVPTGSDGLCLPASGGTQIKNEGETCGQTEGICASGLLCVNEGGAQSVCRATCNPAAPSCPTGTGCVSVQGGGVCVPGGPNPTKQNGDACQSGGECISGICVGSQSTGQFFCRAGCDPNNPQCGASETCVGLQGGGGACLPGGAATKGIGETCNTPGECISNTCVQGSSGPPFCTDTCTTTANCPCGMECNNTSLGWLCIPGNKVACVNNGQACTGNSECISNNCASGTCMAIPNPDAGVPDGPVPQVDSGTNPQPDSGSTTADAGTTNVDSGTGNSDPGGGCSLSGDGATPSLWLLLVLLMRRRRRPERSR